jgi:channel protein (hemolysin III family)
LVAGLIGAPILLFAAFEKAAVFYRHVVFTITMLAVYLGSTLYHAWPSTPGNTCCKCSIIAVFAIAGTYTRLSARFVGGWVRPCWD